MSNPGAGSINANGVFTGANVAAAQTATITATDKRYTDIKGTATITVYPTLAFELPEGYDPNNPATWPLVLPGGEYAFAVTGGEGTSYTWTVTGPLEVAGGEGGEFTFVAPSIGAFAGVYTVTVTDDLTGEQFSMNIKVPMTFAPNKLTMVGDSTVTYDFVVAGAPVGAGFAVKLVTTAKADIADQTEYGAVDPPEGEGVFDESATADIFFTPADITGTYKSFLFKAQAIEDEDAGTPLKDKGLDIVYSGLMRIYPAAEFNGSVKDVNDQPIEGVEVSVLMGSALIQKPVFTDAEGTFSFKVPDPAIIMQDYMVVFGAEGYVAQAVTTKGWENPKLIVLAEEIPGHSISGTVFVLESDETIAGAIVETTGNGGGLVTYTDESGNYVLNFSVGGTWNYSTSDNTVVGEGCLAENNETGTVTITQNGSAYLLEVVTDDGQFQFPGILSEGTYVFTLTSGDETRRITFSLNDPTTAAGRVEWTLEGCSGEAVLNLTRNLGEGGVLMARASKLGYKAEERDILTNPDFGLEPQSAGAVKTVCEAGGSFVWGPAIVEIPAGALDRCYNIEVDENIPVGTAGHCTQKSVVLMEVNITDGDGIAATLAKPIKITMPFNMEAVVPGDFRAGKALIYYAETLDVLRSGNDTNVDWVPRLRHCPGRPPQRTGDFRGFAPLVLWHRRSGHTRSWSWTYAHAYAHAYARCVGRWRRWRLLYRHDDQCLWWGVVRTSHPDGPCDRGGGHQASGQIGNS